MPPATAADLFAALRGLDILPPGDPPPDGPADAFGKQLVAAGALTKFQLDAALRGKADRLRVGAFVLLGRLGEGGMGQVFRGRHARLGTPVAVKVIRRDAADSPVAVERFLREIRQVARLDHPNVVRALDAGRHGGLLYLVTEFVDGETLADEVKRRGPLPAAEACRAAADAARGLVAVHAAGLTHRDVKPTNLMRAADGGTVKLLDLGLAGLAARATDATTATLTHAGVLLGTPAFMAPEQVQNPHAADGRADLYSLGCTLFALLTGRPPFDSRSPVETLFRQVSEPPPVLSDAPPGAAAVVARLLAKDPAARFQTGGEAAAALDAVAAGTWTDEPGPTEEVAVVPVVRRRRWRLPAAVGIAVAIAVGAWLLTRGGGPLPPPIEPATPDAELRALRAAVRPGADAAKVRADVFAFAARNPPLSPAALALLRRLPSPLDDLRPVGGELPGLVGFLPAAAPPRHAGAAVRLAASPDGTLIATAGVDRTVRLWDAGTGRLVRTLTGHADPLSDVAFRPDGTHVAAASGLQSSEETEGFERQVRVWDVATGDLVRTLGGNDRGQDWAVSVAYGPGGQGVLTGRYDGWRIRREKDDTILKAFDGPTNWVVYAAFAHDRRSVVAVCNDLHVRVWDSATGRETQKWKACDWFPTGFAVAADGSRVLVVATDRVRVWALADGKPVSDSVLKPDPLAAAFAPDGSAVVAGLADGALAWLDAAGNEVARTPGHDGAVRHVAWPAAGRAYSTGNDGVVRRWDATTRTEIGRIEAPRAADSLAFADADRTLIVTRPGRPAEAWDVVARTKADLPAAGVVSPDGRRLLALGDGVRLWDVATRTATAIDTPGLDPALAAWSADGRFAVVVGRTGEADRPAVIDVDARKVARRLASGVRNPAAAAMSRTGRWAAAATDGKKVVVWDATTGAAAFALDPPEPEYKQGMVRHLGFRPDPDRLVACGWRADAESFAVPAGTRADGWTPPDGRAFGWVSSPDEQTRAAWTGASRVSVLDRADKVLREVPVPGRVTAAAFSADGRLLAIGIADGRVALVRVGP